MKKYRNRMSILVVLTLVITGIAFTALSLSSCGEEETTTVVDDGRATLVMLGVGGGPPFWGYPGEADHAAIGFMLVVEGEQYLIDCGGGTPNNIYRAGYRYSGVHNVFFTHLHLDHMLGYAELMGRGIWTIPDPEESLKAWGPPGTKAMNDNAYLYYMEGGQNHNQSRMHPEEAEEFDVPETGITEVYRDANVIVTATQVYHAYGLPCYAYRFDIIAGPSTGKSIVFSGDVGPGIDWETDHDGDENLLELAQGATVLVLDTQDNDLVDERIIANAKPELQQGLAVAIKGGHTDVKDGPGIALAAGVEILVLQHYVPAGEPIETFLHKSQAAAKACGYEGEIIAPTELDKVYF